MEEVQCSIVPEWQAKLDAMGEADSAASEERVCGQIRATVGKARILMNAKGRFNQFNSLIDACEHGLGEKETKHTDLEVLGHLL